MEVGPEIKTRNHYKHAPKIPKLLDFAHPNELKRLTRHFGCPGSHDS